MDIFTQDFTLKTDGNGRFSYGEEFDTSPYWPTGVFWDPDVGLHATLLSPKSTQVKGKFDVDGLDGNPSNKTRSFKLVPDQRITVGTFEITKGLHIMRVWGTTTPPVKNDNLQVRIHITYP